MQEKTIQWFPGHMAKAKRLIIEKRKLIDLFIVLLDGRAPLASQNPELADIINNKPVLYILTKTDLADPQVTKQWVAKFRNEKKNVLALDVKSPTKSTIKVLVNKVKRQLSEKIAKEKNRGIIKPRLRILIMGIPNVGKSTLINALAGQKVAVVANRPGVTKNQQWIKTAHAIDIIDSPGILWPKFKDQNTAKILAWINTIKQTILPLEVVATSALLFLNKHYNNKLINAYNMNDLVIDPNNAETINECWVVIAKRYNKIHKDISVIEKFSQERLLHDLRNQKFGKLSFEIPIN